MATKREIDEYWSIIDLAECHDAMDIKAEIEMISYEKAKKEGGKK